MKTTAVLVDDERPALRGIENLLKEFPEISIIGTYTDPIKAINEIELLKPHVVFLDINMPQLMGTDVASKINAANPETDIVFVTAYDQYAVEAFELYALDYILKPIDPPRFKKSVERLLKKPTEVENTAKKLQIKCLGRFQVGWQGKEPIRWRAEKTRELFAFLLHSQGNNVSKDLLLDKLWPNDNPDRAIRQLYNGIYYIRKALEEYGIDRSLVSIDNSYNLKLGAVDYDVGRVNELKRNSDDSIETLEEIVEQFGGDYLEGEYYHWATGERTRLENLMQQCLITLAVLCIENREYSKAEYKLKEAYKINPYEERVTELFMKLYLYTEEQSKAIKHFKEYTELIKDELGLQPNEKIYELYQSINRFTL
ncbi:MAG: response regulator [Firmicutes bacterium]|nr:response regulator [Bacillota bacterium]